MHTIYRIELPHPQPKVIGVGAYRAPSTFRNKILALHNGEDHPSLYQDFNNDEIGKLHHCACPTLEKLSEWFHDLIKLAYSDGLRVAEYEVTCFKIGASRMQCVFTKDDIINKRYLELGDVLKE